MIIEYFTPIDFLSAEGSKETRTSVPSVEWAFHEDSEQYYTTLLVQQVEFKGDMAVAIDAPIRKAFWSFNKDRQFAIGVTFGDSHMDADEVAAYHLAKNMASEVEVPEEA